jgi:arylsulfatase A-like enzyme
MVDAARIGRTIGESVPHRPAPRKPPEGAPNVVVIVLDDLGFGQLGAFGSHIATPTIDRLAGGGLRYNRFHVTSLCSPTRAALLTGRNHHAVGMGFLSDIPIGFPGYDGRIPRSAATLPRVLRDAGYSTFAVGKWHLTPRWEFSASGPFDHWPLGLGFERYYGFLGGDTNQYAPELVCDNGFVDQPKAPEDGYHLTEDLADRAIRFVQDQQQATPGKPFFLYFATGAMHAPHQVAPEWSDRYHGRFDQGWEAWREQTFARQLAAGIVPEGTVLPPRPPWVPDWDTLPAAEQRLYARMMEVFAGFLSHTDAQIGRVIDHLEATGELDNTLVLLISDNGASAEGGPTGSLNEHRFVHDEVDELSDTLAHIDDIGTERSYNHYPWGWAWAGNTPLKLWKRFTWLGGVRTPLIVHWPRGIEAAGEVRSQFAHVVDLMPTVLEAVGIDAPLVVDGITQLPIAGGSLVPSFADPVAPTRITQYFEMLGSRAIFHEGWKATTDHVGRQLTVEWEALPGSHSFDDDHWALFDLEHDFSESEDLAAQHPERVRMLEGLWWAEAGRNQVLPLEDEMIGRFGALITNPWGPVLRAEYLPGGGPIAEETLPPLGAGFDLLVDLEVADLGTSGILTALGDRNNGWATYLLEGRPVVAFSILGSLLEVHGADAVGTGAHRVGVNYARDAAGGGIVRLSVDGVIAAEGHLDHDLPFRWQIGSAGLTIGLDRGLPVTDDYRPPFPFPFPGRIERVVLESVFAPRPDPEAAVRAALHRE